MPKIQKVNVETFHEQSPFDRALTVWTNWMYLEDRPYSDGDANPQDTKEFMAAGEAMNAMIDDLPRHLWWAVRRRCGLCTVWNFPNLDLGAALQQAEDILMPKIKNNLATRRLLN